ncbi:conjugal transfer protein traD [Vibrio sp. SS-MA-C1-2]|uniref:conjugal transfer protein traD n=1 Tax=Vibrio sp. SS-MA-C1-2 TaxID=2908646 RepID=UPI001F36FE8F|nr:conjugal transfer protein traD [Vibrio sp. SS-MA-C1-2]UJF17257.1 conjugal transfer protein traD [Vibrio sp. SS-MA-C1-2]
MTENTQYASYNVLARKALIAGVPILTLLTFLCFMLITGFGGMMLFGFAKGLIIPSLLAMLLFFIRIKCIDDSRAMEGLKWDINSLFYRMLCRSSVISFSATDETNKQRYLLISQTITHV